MVAKGVPLSSVGFNRLRISEETEGLDLAIKRAAEVQGIDPGVLRNALCAMSAKQIEQLAERVKNETVDRNRAALIKQIENLKFDNKPLPTLCAKDTQNGFDLYNQLNIDMDFVLHKAKIPVTLTILYEVNVPDDDYPDCGRDNPMRRALKNIQHYTDKSEPGGWGLAPCIRYAPKLTLKEPLNITIAVAPDTKAADAAEFRKAFIKGSDRNNRFFYIDMNRKDVLKTWAENLYQQIVEAHKRR